MVIRVDSIESILDGVRNTIIKSLDEVNANKLHSSGFIQDASKPKESKDRYVQLCTFEEDEDGDPHMFSAWGMDIIGYTDRGIISDLCIGIDTYDYVDMSTEQLLFAYTTALVHGDVLE